jgi:hypothetical protein
VQKSQALPSSDNIPLNKWTAYVTTMFLLHWFMLTGSLIQCSLAAEPRIQFEVTSCENYCGRIKSRKGFSEFIRVSHLIIVPPLLYTHLSVPLELRYSPDEADSKCGL